MKEKGMGECLSPAATYLCTAWKHKELQISKSNEKLGKRSCSGLDIDK